MSCSIAVEGAVKGCPAKLAVWYDKNEMSFYGELQMDQRGPAGLLEAVNSEMASKFEAIRLRPGTCFQSTRHSFLHSWNHSPGLWRTRAVFQGSSRQGKRSHSFFIFSRQ